MSASSYLLSDLSLFQRKHLAWEHLLSDFLAEKQPHILCSDKHSQEYKQRIERRIKELAPAAPCKLLTISELPSKNYTHLLALHPANTPHFCAASSQLKRICALEPSEQIGLQEQLELAKTLKLSAVLSPYLLPEMREKLGPIEGLAIAQKIHFIPPFLRSQKPKGASSEKTLILYHSEQAFHTYTKESHLQRGQVITKVPVDWSASLPALCDAGPYEALDLAAIESLDALQATLGKYKKIHSFCQDSQLNHLLEIAAAQLGQSISIGYTNQASVVRASIRPIPSIDAILPQALCKPADIREVLAPLFSANAYQTQLQASAPCSHKTLENALAGMEPLEFPENTSLEAIDRGLDLIRHPKRHERLRQFQTERYLKSDKRWIGTYISLLSAYYRHCSHAQRHYLFLARDLCEILCASPQSFDPQATQALAQDIRHTSNHEWEWGRCPTVSLVPYKTFALTLLGEEQAALKLCKDALEATYVENAYSYMAKAYKLLGNEPKAIEYYLKDYEAQQQDPNTLLELMVSLWKQSPQDPRITAFLSAKDPRFAPKQLALQRFIRIHERLLEAHAQAYFTEELRMLDTVLEGSAPQGTDPELYRFAQYLCAALNQKPLPTHPSGKYRYAFLFAATLSSNATLAVELPEATDENLLHTWLEDALLAGITGKTAPRQPAPALTDEHLENVHTLWLMAALAALQSNDPLHRHLEAMASQKNPEFALRKAILEKLIQTPPLPANSELDKFLQSLEKQLNSIARKTAANSQLPS